MLIKKTYNDSKIIYPYCNPNYAFEFEFPSLQDGGGPEKCFRVIAKLPCLLKKEVNSILWMILLSSSETTTIFIYRAVSTNESCIISQRLTPVNFTKAFYIA